MRKLQQTGLEFAEGWRGGGGYKADYSFFFLFHYECSLERDWSVKTVQRVKKKKLRRINCTTKKGCV